MKKSILLFLFLLVGCAGFGSNEVYTGPTLSQYQSNCEQIYPKLSQVAECINNATQGDKWYSRDPNVKLYVLKAKSLGEQVDNGGFKDTDARLELQTIFINMANQRDAELREQYAVTQAQDRARGNAIAQALQNMQNSNYKVIQPQINPNISMTCTRWGNTVNCNSH